MASEKARKKAEQLMALATRSTFSEEGRTAAMAAVKLIAEHDLLSTSRDQGLGRALARVDDGELARLRAEVAELRRAQGERQIEAPKPAPEPKHYTSYALADLSENLREIDSLRREVARLRAAPRVHVVRPGESPLQIATMYGVSLAQLLAANPSKPTVQTANGWTFATLRVGESLRLP